MPVMMEYDDSNETLAGQAGQTPISVSLRRGERRKNMTPISSTVSGESDSSPRDLVEMQRTGKTFMETCATRFL